MQIRVPAALLVVLCAAPFSASLGQSLQFGPTGLALGENREQMDTPYYRVERFDWFGAVLDESYGIWCYPTPQDCSGPGYFNMSPENAARADFNQDGREDLVLAWNLFPHTIPRTTRATYSILLNDGMGGMRDAPELFEDGGPVRMQPYRTFTADFNQDGRPDIVSGSPARIERHPDGSTTATFEPIPLVLSTAEGTLRDASSNIAGQEEGGVPACFNTGHDLSIGDVDGNGAVDIYSGGCLFLNDGTGMFANASAQLSEEMSPYWWYIMSSAMGDLDNDGTADVVAAYHEGDVPGYIMLSGSNQAIAERAVLPLPSGRHGANTKFNHAVVFDVDQDGWNDIVFSVTRADPYYVGRGLQVLMNRGGLAFVDETAARIVEPGSLDTRQGEGAMHVVDINADGRLDIVHSGDTGSVYINSNGRLHAQEDERLAWVQPWQIAGYAAHEPHARRAIATFHPVDLDGQAGVDYVSFVQKILGNWPQDEPSVYAFYSVLSTAPIPVPDIFTSGFEQ